MAKQRTSGCAPWLTDLGSIPLLLPIRSSDSIQRVVDYLPRYIIVGRKEIDTPDGRAARLVPHSLAGPISASSSSTIEIHIFIAMAASIDHG